MRKIRFCFEIQGVGGFSVGGWDEPADWSTEKYEALMKSVNVGEFLKLAGLDEVFSAADCRVITPEEYDRKYADGEEDCEPVD